jgi:hypothetical protein
MNLIQTIETDLQAAGKWLETEVEGIANEVWNVIKVVFTTAEPTIVNGVVTALKEFLPTVSAEVASGTPLEVLEQNFVMWALNEGKIVLGDVEQLGSTLVQSLIALTIKSLPSTT